MSNKLYKFAAEEVYKIDSEISGINAEREISRMFANEYCKIGNKSWKVRLEMRILVLENILESNLRDDVTYRKAEMKDKDILLEMLKEIRREIVNEEMSDEEALEKFDKSMENGYYILEKEGKIVAQASINKQLLNGKLVGSVFTVKNERGKGYAYNLVYRLSKDILENGAKYCALFTDDSNQISNHVYEKIGYRRIADVTEIKFE